MRCRPGSLIICLALFTACGGETTVTTSNGSTSLPTTTATTAPPATSTTAPEPDGFGTSEAIIAASDALTSSLGAEEAAVAVVLALDHGYSFRQLMDAAGQGRLGTDGTIPGVDPEYGAYGLLTDGSTTAANASATVAPQAVPAVRLIAALPPHNLLMLTAKELIKVAADALDRMFSSPLEAEGDEEPTRLGLTTIGLLLQLSSMGYSFEQIVDGILFGELTLLKPAPEEFNSMCLSLTEFESEGSLVAITPASPPASEASGPCKVLVEEFGKGEDANILARTPDSDGWFSVGVTTAPATSITTTTTEPENDPFPWTFTGTGTVNVTVTTTNQLQYSTVWEFTITLYEDGSLDYIHLLPRDREGYAISCPSGDVYADTFTEPVEVTRQGTHENGRLSIPITYADDRHVVQGGTYTQDAVHLDSISSDYEAGCEPGAMLYHMTEFPFDIPRSRP
jgi:hypothetical protein